MTDNKFISVGMPGDECCSCEPIFMSNLVDLEYCDAQLGVPESSDCNHDGALWVGSWPGTVCSQYPIVGFPACITGDGARIVQVCPPIATTGGAPAGEDHCRNTTVREYSFTILDSGLCQPPWYPWTSDCRAGSGLPAVKICISDDGENEPFPNPNQCCTGVDDLPAPTGNGTWFFKCSGEEPCKGKCDTYLALDGTETPKGFCFPHTCCPCPESGSGEAGDRTVSISVSSSSGGFSKDLAIPYNFDICQSAYGSPANTFCYNSDGYDNKGIRAEKYGATGLQLCDPAQDCSGQRVNLTLCCCEVPQSQGESASGFHDCHVCNYQFTMEFLPLNAYMDVPPSEGTKYCFCPTGIDPESFEPEQALLPGDDFIGNGAKRINQTFTLIDGSCQPFYLEYIASGQYWNCDCLLAGQEEDVSNDVVIKVTIT